MSRLLVSIGTKTCEIIKLYQSNLCTQRSFSLKVSEFQKHLEELSTLSGLTQYVNKEMYMLETNVEKEEALTLRQLLDECKSPTDVLSLIGNMHQMGKLWNDELMYYFVKLAQLNRFQQSSHHDKKVSVSNILNDHNFHVLLHKVVFVSPCMKSTDLVFCFRSAANLMIPANSFVITRLVEVMQQRINDFFPKDVAICNSGLLRYNPLQTQSMLALQNGLLLHLENIAEDESFFVKTAVNEGLTTALNLSKHYGPSASLQLRKCLSTTVVEYMKRHKTDETINDDTAVKAIVTLSRLRYFHKPSIAKSLRALTSNPGQLSSNQQTSLSKSFQYLKFPCNEQQIALLKQKFSDDFHQLYLPS